MIYLHHIYIFDMSIVQATDDVMQQKEDGDNQDIVVDTSLQGQEIGCEGDDLSWSQLFIQISQKMSTLRQVKEERQSTISAEDGERHVKVWKKWL